MVFGIPDEIMGEAVVAVIQAPNIIDQHDLRREIIAHCNKKFPSYKVPKKIFFFDEFPLNSSNKVDLAALKQIVFPGMHKKYLVIPFFNLYLIFYLQYSS